MPTVLAASTSSSSLTVVATVVAALVTSAAGVLAAWTASRLGERVGRARAEAASERTLEDRLDELAKSMRRSSRLVEEVSAELEAKAATAKRLQEEADTAQALAALHKEQTEAVRRMLDAELTGATRRIRADSIKIGVASFIAGGGITLMVTLLVHPLH